MSRVVLVNPNTDRNVTESMVAIAREAVSGEAELVGLTTATGALLITDGAALRMAADTVIALARIDHEWPPN